MSFKLKGEQFTSLTQSGLRVNSPALSARGGVRSRPRLKTTPSARTPKRPKRIWIGDATDEGFKNHHAGLTAADLRPVSH
jgi:hypothetical protein